MHTTSHSELSQGTVTFIHGNTYLIKPANSSPNASLLKNRKLGSTFTCCFMKICVFERNVERLTNAEREGSQETSGAREIEP